MSQNRASALSVAFPEDRRLVPAIRYLAASINAIEPIDQKVYKGENIIKIDGITLCTGRAKARRIYIEISTGQDLDSIEAIADLAFAG